MAVIQVIVALDAVIADAVTPDGATGAVRERVADVEGPFHVAVMVTDWSATSVPVLAPNVAEVALAGTVTEEGTVNRDGALLESATTVLPAEDLDRVTVQVVLALEGRVAAAHCREDRVMAGAVRERVADVEGPFHVAVMVTVWSATSVPVLAPNVAEVTLAGTVTEEGTVNRDGALLESATTVLPAEDFDKVTVQVVLALEARLAVAHCREESVTVGDNRERVADVEEPFSVAVMVTVWSATSGPVLALNVAEVALAGTVTEEGTVRADGALLESTTTVLPAEDFDKVTVQVVLALEARVAAAHCREESVTGGDNRERVADVEEPFSVAVSVTVLSEISVPVVAINVAEVALAATVTEEGTVNTDGALLESATMVLPALYFDKVTVQIVLALEGRLVAAHCREDRVTAGAVRERVADVEEPFSVAVILAV